MADDIVRPANDEAKLSWALLDLLDTLVDIAAGPMSEKEVAQPEHGQEGASTDHAEAGGQRAAVAGTASPHASESSP